jgi:hypothetical protein
MTYSTSTILPDKLASVFTKPFDHSTFPARQLLLAFCEGSSVDAGWDHTSRVKLPIA